MKRTHCDIYNGCNCENCPETALQLNIKEEDLQKLKKAK